MIRLVLRSIYPSSHPPVANDFAILSEALVVADKYDDNVARVPLRSLPTEFVKKEPVGAYSIACRFEVKVASSLMTSIYLPDLAELPDEFKHIQAAADYHRLILLHSKYRKEIMALANRTPFPRQDIKFLDIIRILLASAEPKDEEERRNIPGDLQRKASR